MNTYPDEYYSYRAASMLHLKTLNTLNSNNLPEIENYEQNNTVVLPFEYTNWTDIDKEWIALAMNAGDMDIIDDLMTKGNSTCYCWKSFYPKTREDFERLTND